MFITVLNKSELTEFSLVKQNEQMGPQILQVFILRVMKVVKVTPIYL